MPWSFLEFPWEVMLEERQVWDRAPPMVRPENGGGVLCRGESTTSIDALASSMHRSRLSNTDTWLEYPGPSLRPEGLRSLPFQKPGLDTEAHLPYENAPQSDPNAWAGRFHEWITDSLQEFVSLLFDERKKKRNRFLEKQLSGTIAAFHRHSDDDPASRALICELAADTVTPVETVVNQPRKVLNRKHAQVGLERLQEMDVASLIDYARRPGNTAAIKAGDRQRLMAVVREETVNTLENRVVHDFCRRARDAAMRYVADECHRCDHDSCNRTNIQGQCGSARVKRAESFVRRCELWLASPTLSSVLPLSVPCRIPNYALLQNVRYVQIWDAYQKLLRQEDVREQTWRWKRRTWCDCVRILMMETMRTLTCHGHQPPFQASDKPIRIRREPQYGCWIKSEPFDGPVVFESNGGFTSVYLFNREDVDRALDELPLPLALLNADLYWVAVSTLWPEVRVMPVWAVVGDSRWQDDGTARALRSACMDDVERARQSWHKRAAASKSGLEVGIRYSLLIRAADCDNQTSNGSVTIYEVSAHKKRASAVSRNVAQAIQEMIA